MKNQTMPEETVTRIRQHLTTLKLTAMRKSLDTELAKAAKQPPTPTQLLERLLAIEAIGFDRLEQHDARNASLFFKVIYGRYCKGSTLITTNIAFKELGDYLGDPVVTTAIVDRMVHHSVIINIEGPSWRMHESKKLNARTTKPAKTK